MTTTTTDKRIVTPEQLDKCSRIENWQAHRIEYRVKNSHGDVDETGEVIEYTVFYNPCKQNLQCTCPAGNPPIVEGLPLYAPRNCWHMRAAVQHAKEYLAERRLLEDIWMAELQADIDEEARAHADNAPHTIVEDETSSSLDGVRFEIHNGCSIPMR